MTGLEPIEAAGPRWRCTRLITVTSVALLLSARSATADDAAGRYRWFGQVELQASLLSNLGDRAIDGTSFGPAAKIGYRWGRWGLFASIEHNAWVSSEGDDTGVQAGALNIGIGGELTYGHRWLRASATLGPSILLYETGLDPAGSTGLYIDLRPAGIRFPLSKRIVVLFDPVSFALVSPVLTGIPLVFVQYRTTVATEFIW